jgi:hypothetical protein
MRRWRAKAVPARQIVDASRVAHMKDAIIVDEDFSTVWGDGQTDASCNNPAMDHFHLP